MREGEKVVLKVRRQEPADAEPTFSTYEVPYQKYMWSRRGKPEPRDA